MGLPENSIPRSSKASFLLPTNLFPVFLLLSFFGGIPHQELCLFLLYKWGRLQWKMYGTSYSTFLSLPPFPHLIKYFCLFKALKITISISFQGRKYTNNVAKLYSVNVTNVLDGVASYCRRCALESSGSSCTSCPAGHYIDRDSGGCYPCLPNTYLKAHQPYGSQACIPCGPGTKNNKVLLSSSYLIILQL